VCDRSFKVAFEQEKTVVDAQDIYEATQRIGLRTDVFHYIVSLKNRERKSQEPHPAADKPVSETAPSDKEPSPSIVKKAEQGRIEMINEIPDTSGIRIGVSDLSPADQKGLKVPVTLLLFSIAALTFSVLFFCQRAGSAGFTSCLMDLIRF
jgi:general secretion pathway protein A